MEHSSLYTILQSFANLDNEFVFHSSLMNIIETELENQLLEEALQQSLEEEQPKEKHILSEEGIHSIEHVIYDSNKIDSHECPITQETFIPNETISKLPCGHYFNTDSIIYWLQNESATCPVCRIELEHETIIQR